MDKKIEILHKICEALFEELSDYSRKIEKSDDMSAGDLETIDKLSHALKSIKTTIAMMEADEEGGNSYRGGNSNRYMPWYGGMSYEDGNMGDGRYNRGMSSARRGRANNPMGRNQYSREGGYSYAEEEFEMALRDAMNAAPDDRMREKIKKMMENA